MHLFIDIGFLLAPYISREINDTPGLNGFEYTQIRSQQHEQLSNSTLSETFTDNECNQCKNTYCKEEVHVVTETKIYICSIYSKNTVLFNNVNNDVDKDSPQ